eukprot:2253787-Prymnesium_polylepis.5
MPSGYRIVLRRRTDPAATLSQDPIAGFQNPMFPPPASPQHGRVARDAASAGHPQTDAATRDHLRHSDLMVDLRRRSAW